MDDRDWQLLLSRIRSGSCTPFLGAGACGDVLPHGADIARRWAAEHGYPLEDSDDLARVAQFLGVHWGDAMYPKELIQRELEDSGNPDYSSADEPHSALARLPLSVYITTNYDAFMVGALEHHRKDPTREYCRWNGSPAVRGAPALLDPIFAPTPANPLVFHLHGWLGIPESLVLTEDDYLDFLVAVSRDAELLPHQIERALATTSLLFIGYRLADWDFRVLHRGLVMMGEPSLRRISVTVQLKPGDAAQEYLSNYFGAMNVRVYWGTAEEFISELRQRWEAFDTGA